MALSQGLWLDSIGGQPCPVEEITTFEHLLQIAEDETWTTILLALTTGYEPEQDPGDSLFSGAASRGLQQVGIAYLTGASLKHRLQRFHTEAFKPQILQDYRNSSGVRSLSLTVGHRTPQAEIDYRRQHSSEPKNFVTLEDLDKSITEFVQLCDPDGWTRVVLIASQHLVVELCSIQRYFPGLGALVSHWVSLDRIWQQFGACGAPPERSRLLRVFGHGDWEMNSAENVAISKLALFEALLRQDNQSKLLLQHRFENMCDNMTIPSSYSAPCRFRAGVAVSNEALPLPPELDSALKLARRYFHFGPIRVEVPPTGTGILWFTSHRMLDHFVETVNALARSLPELCPLRAFSLEDEQSWVTLMRTINAVNA